MRKLLIIKTGSTFDLVKNKYGDYEDQIIHQIGINHNDITVIPVYQNVMPWLPEGVSSIIITGSKEMVTDYEPWIVNTANWIKNIVPKQIPILGICFGHQLLAYAFGGTVNYHPKGPEYGQVDIVKSPNIKEDILFGGLPDTFRGYVAHYQTITKLPKNAIVLANNNFENSHAVRFDNHVWGVQFHPEFNADIARMHVKGQEHHFNEIGITIDDLYLNIEENNYGRMILQRFYGL